MNEELLIPVPDTSQTTSQKDLSIKQEDSAPKRVYYTFKLSKNVENISEDKSKIKGENLSM